MTKMNNLDEVMIIIHAEDSEILAKPPDGLQYYLINQTQNSSLNVHVQEIDLP